VVQRDTNRRRIRAFLIVSLVMLGAAGATRLFGPSVFAPRVNIRWSSGTSNTVRQELERRLGLVAADQRENRTWAYDLPDPSRIRIRAIVNHPAVEDTYRIDREQLTTTADAPRGRTRLARPGPAGWIHGPVFEWFIFLWLSSFLVSATWLASNQAGDRTS
jgi:hypothetical protein